MYFRLFRIYFSIVGIILCQCWGMVHAQPLDPTKKLTQYNVDKWTGEGLTSSSILQIIQTKDGYLWMVTYSALVRFDGVTFTAFDRFNVAGLTATGFRSLYEDRFGNLWIGGNGGGLFRKTDNGFIHYEVPFGPTSNNIKRIFRDSNDHLWLCTIKGLIKYADSTFTLITPDGYSDDVDFTTYDIAEDDEGKLWVGSAAGMFVYDGNKLIKAGVEGNQLNDEVLSILIDNEKIWISSYNRGMYLYQNGLFTKFQELDTIWHPVSLYQDGNKNLWIGTEAGLARYNSSGLSFINASSGLSHNAINTIVEDHEGSIWVGTYYGGLNRLRDGPFINFTVLNGLADNTIHCVYQSSDSIVWIGTENGLTLYKNGVLQGVNDYGLQQAKVRDVFQDSRGNLWVATYSGVVKIRNGTSVKYTVDDGLSNNQTRLIFEDNKNRIWVGTRSGLNLYKDGNWEVLTVEDGLVNDFITSMMQLNDEEVLIGTTGGLQVLKDDKIVPYNLNSGNIRFTVFRTYQDKEGIIWLGTSGGLLRLDNHDLYSFSSDHKLLGSTIFEVIEDGNGVFWLTSDKGVIRVSRSELMQKTQNDTVKISPTLFDKSNGLRSSEITGVANATRTFDGSIWFPTLEGVAVLNPDKIMINEIPPPLIIHKLVAGGRDYQISERVVIPPNSRNIEVHYAGLSYMIPQKVKFRYMLEGYDEDWNDVGDRRIAYYTSLPPGTYSFKLAACNNDGVWNVKDDALTFVVEKAFWQTNIFYGFSVLAMAFLIFGVVDFRTRRVKKLNKDLEDKITARTSEVLLQKEEIETQRDYIESRNKELENARNVIARQYADLQEINENLEAKVVARTVELQKAYTELIQANEELDDFVYKSAHDIKGPLARLQGLCNLAKMETNDPAVLTCIRKLERESILANRILEKLSHAHEVKNMKPQISEVNLKKLMSEVVDMLQPVEGSDKVNFEIDIKDNLTLMTDKKLLKELVYNVLENTVVFRNELNAKVNIKVVVQQKEVVMSVADNGIPVDENVRPDIYKMFVKGSEKSEGLGLGLYIAKKAAEGLYGSIVLKENDNRGNVFEVRLPLNF